MVVYIAACIGACAFVVFWALGLNSDVSGLIALSILCIGVLVHVLQRNLGEREPGGL